eukprot:scaffold31053_cov17-Tisochrysis_lutea.AAC.1
MDFSDIKYGYCQAQGDLTSAPLLAQEHTLVASKGGISVQYTMIIKPGMQVMNWHRFLIIGSPISSSGVPRNDQKL